MVIFDLSSFRTQIILIIAAVFLFFLVLSLLKRILWKRQNQKEIEHAGREGEEFVTNTILKTLRADDYLFTNVKVKWRDKKTELDNVIINRHGVFVIEAKNFNGTLLGSEDAHTWQKVKKSKAGNQYIDIVRNPLGQLKREIYIFSNMLRDNGFRIWIDGYVYFVNNNSPVDSELVLHSQKEIHKTIHPGGKPKLSEKTIGKLLHQLRKYSLAA